MNEWNKGESAYLTSMSTRKGRGMNSINIIGKKERIMIDLENENKGEPSQPDASVSLWVGNAVTR